MPDLLSHGQTSRAFFGRQFSQTSQASGFSDSLGTSNEKKVISQKSKKKPDPVDVALENEGLCRKLIPRDGNTIFRAVSDQLYGTQAHHEEVRETLLLYFYEKHEELQQIIDNYQNGSTFIDYITHKMVCAVQNCFKVDIHLFDESGKRNVYEYDKEGDSEAKGTVYLAVDRQLCWDSVYSVEFLRVQGISQSLVYEILYENVFKLKNVPFAVENMLGKPKKTLQQAGKNKPNKEAMLSLLTNSHKDAALSLDLKVLIDMGIPPFPYKVAKSLSPYVYRNTEYDVCEAVKGSNSENIRKNFLFEGCKCIIHKRSNYRYYGYVQRLFPEQNRAIVFVEQLGELCEIAIDLIEPVIATKKSNSRSRRRSSKYMSRSSFLERDDIEILEEDEVDDDVFMKSEDFSNNSPAIPEDSLKEDDGQKSIEMEPVQSEPQRCVEDVVMIPLASNIYNNQMTYNVIPAQPTLILDTAFNCIMAINGPYNGAKVPGYTGLINKSAIPSYLPDGSDLPYSDMSTVRFFYNLGQKHFQAATYTLFKDQNLLCVVASTENLPPCSRYYAHLMSPVNCSNNKSPYPLCQYAHELTCGCKTASGNLKVLEKTENAKTCSEDFGSQSWAAAIEKSYEDILNGNPACLNMISFKNSGVCRTCMFHYFGNYFAHYPRSFPFPVNLCCQPSTVDDGSDLPFSDISSLRYFYNLGVRNHQAAELTYLHQQNKICYEQMFGEWPDDLDTECAIHDKFTSSSKDMGCSIYNVYRNALEKQFYQNITIISQVSMRPVQMCTLTSEVPLSGYVVPGPSQFGPFGGL